MEKKIISISYEIPGNSDLSHNYSSDQSLLDGDIIVFEPMFFYSASGKSSYSEDTSYELRKNTNRWRTELATALEYGKTVFLFLKKFQTASIHTGKREFKGARTINYVEDFNNYEFLPVTLPRIIAGGGSEIIFTGHPAFVSFWKEFKDNLKFESYIDGKIKIPIFLTKTGQRPLGGVIKVGQGNLVFMPPIFYDEKKFATYDKIKEESFWTKEAIVFGNKLIKSLIEIDTALKSESQITPPPEWVNAPIYLSEEEKGIIFNIDRTSSDMEKLIVKKSSLNEKLLNTRQLKKLLFETGKSLERAVILSLQILGYSAENYNDGELELDQVIISPEGQRFIGECEGKDTSAINIDKFRQLEENIQSDLTREEVENPAIGILFGNGFRLTKPEEREEQFTKKCLSSAKRGTILIRTSDLYKVAQYLKDNNNENFASACRTAIVNSIGSIVIFPKIPVQNKKLLIVENKEETI